MDTKTIIQSTLSNKVNHVIFLCITVLLSNLFLVLTPYFIGKLINELTLVNININNVIFYSVLAGIFLVLRLLCEYVELKQVYRLGDFITSALQKESYTTIMKADVSQLQKVSPKFLTDSITRDCIIIGKEYVSKNVIKFINHLCYLIIAFIMMLAISPVLGMIVLAGVPVYYFGVSGMRKLFKNNQTGVDYLKFEETKIIEENFNLLKEIKIKNGVEKEIKDYKNWLEQNDRKFKHNYVLKNLNSELIRTIIVSVVLIAAISVGVSFLINGINNTTIGDLITCAILIPLIYQAVLKLMDTKVSSSTISSEIDNLNQIFKLRSEQRSEPINQLDELSSIKFTNVCYEDSEGFVRDLSFDVKNNEKLGILCLENTSTDLIQELFIKMKKARSGTITFNNCEFSKINTYYLRDLVASVGSGTRLFDDTIISNITYPLPIDEYKYNDSLYKARLKDIIFDLENKDQTLVTELSEEVHEQISIANAFYKDAKVFVFNSATKKMNSKLADEIQKEIIKLKNKFIIIISDKGHDVVSCDKVVILRNGEVVESGNVNELMKNKDSVLYSSVRRIRVRSKIVS